MSEAFREVDQAEAVLDFVFRGACRAIAISIAIYSFARP